ncbi:hypothetical protein GCM10017779_50010 [Streptomyces capillispiralis]|nr:hypothetical protein GCM10017779_50010 [Streptomyces capillispiralis]
MHAIDGTVVAFEADEVHAVAHAGWSADVTGLASVLSLPPAAACLPPSSGHLVSLVVSPAPVARPASRRATGTRNGEQET